MNHRRHGPRYSDAGGIASGSRPVFDRAGRVAAGWVGLWLILTAGPLFAAPGSGVFPGARWLPRAPAAAGLDSQKLEALASVVGGRGCVVREGFMVYSWGDPAKSSDVASAFKPVLTTLMLMAVQEGLISSPDEWVSVVEPRLRDLNAGKDAAMTWRHLASQMSGYGLPEKPGAAYSYNDYALTLYYDTLMEKVYRTNSDAVLQARLAGPLQFEDPHTFLAFGPKDRPGRLALSCRDFARIGLLYLRGGWWDERPLLRADLARMAIGSPIPADTPRSSGQPAPMLPKQRSLGGGRNITPVGPGYYSFNWWLNRTNAAGQRLLVDASPDVCLASGHGGQRVLYLVPGDDLIVCWNDSPIQDHDASPGNPRTRMNQAAKLIREMVLRNRP